MLRFTSPNVISEDCSTDRDRGERFVLSDHRTASWAGKSKYIISNRVYTAGVRGMECNLLRMCKYVVHLVLKRVQM
jgi:hypothetical protein